MSLVPYSSRDSREIVLRHDDSIVVRDPQSNRIVLRGAPARSSLSECPYCRQPLRSGPQEQEPRASAEEQSFISPEYFRMLPHAFDPSDADQLPPSSPIRRLVQPAFPPTPPKPAVSEDGSEGEFIASAPAATNSAEGQGIKRDAFSPNYFRKFFKEERELGRGGKGVVLLVRHELDGVFLGHFACKRVPVGDDHVWLEKVLIEVQLLQGLEHSNLVSYRHVWLEDMQFNRFGPSVPCAFILQQYCNAGDLLHYVVGDSPVAISTNEQRKEQMRRRSKGQDDRPVELKRKLSFDEIYSFFKDITSGLAHLHASNYIHRDLKPSNCLLHTVGNETKCLISDFGEVQAHNAVRKSTGATGTISYCAPEVLKKDNLGRFGNFSTKSDIFSLGMILYFLCFGRLPYSSADIVQEEMEDLDQLRAEISTWSGFRYERKERPELPDQLYEFLKRLLALNPLDRPSAEEILKAIQTGSGFENAPRIGRGKTAAGNLHLTKRIQSLDTPASGSPAPRNRVVVPSHVDNQIGDGEDRMRRRQTMAASLEQDDRSNSPSMPLLMPPPPRGFTKLKQEMMNHGRQLLSPNSRSHRYFVLSTKIAFFTMKNYSLWRPCLPLASNPTIAYPLLILSALDVCAGTDISLQGSVFLLIIHFGVVVWSVKFGSLCL